MPKRFVLSVLILVVFGGMVSAQSPDSLFLTNTVAAPGDTAEIKLYLRNTQFSVSGFSSRFVLEDYQNAVFLHVERGEAILNFESFSSNMSDSVCRISGFADFPGGAYIPPLPIGYHELATIFIVISSNAPNDFVDSVIFEEDTIPQTPDNGISDSTGYVFEVPTLINGSVTVETVVGIKDDSSIMPDAFELIQNYPNPFNAETTIEFSINNLSNAVSLIIYDILGNHIKEFYWDILNPGSYKIRWNGRSESGNQLSSGVYLYKLADSVGLSQTMKMTLLK